MYTVPLEVSVVAHEHSMNGSLVQVDGGIQSGDLEATWDFGRAHGGDGNPLGILGSAFNVLFGAATARTKPAQATRMPVTFTAEDLFCGSWIVEKWKGRKSL